MDLTGARICGLSILALLVNLCSGYELLQSLTGTIGAENYTYYRLSRVGRLRVELISLSGDADLYVSETTLNPAFDQYTAQSITCGTDIIEIPANYDRPVGIAVYGYPSSELSEYKISIYQLPKTDEMDYEQLKNMFHNYEAADFLFKNYEASDYMYRDIKQAGKPKVNIQTNNENVAEDEDSIGSIVWEILLTLLKVVFEVIL